MKNKTALLSGISGQDGFFLSKLLLQKGYEVHGIIRRSSRNTLNHFTPLPRKLHLHYGDLQDGNSLLDIVLKAAPDEVYNLAAQSHVGISFKESEFTADVTALGTLRLLNAVRHGEDIFKKQIRFYQASSSEMYGKVRETPQTELTPFHPRSPYACSKVFAHTCTVNYREAYGLFGCCGILFNHESEERGDDFVTRKITRGVADILKGNLSVLELGNIDSKRDWGYAKDYVEAMWLMLQQDKPDDYVVATGETYSVREFVTAAFWETGIAIEWTGTGLDEKAVVTDLIPTDYVVPSNVKIGDTLVRIDPEFYRPSEVEYLIGDSTKARTKLGWKPKVGFNELVKIMVKSDYSRTFSLNRKPE